MLYKLQNPIDKQKAITRFKFLLDKGKVIELTEKKDKPRTLPQNNLLHLWITVLADEFGYLEKEDCKRDIKRTILGMKENINKLTGEIDKIDYSTSAMTTEDLSTFMDKLKTWASTEHGIYLPYVGDPGYEEMINMYKNR